MKRENERNNNYQMAVLQNNDNQNQRNHELAMFKVSNAEQLANARINEGNALLQQQAARR